MTTPQDPQDPADEAQDPVNPYGEPPAPQPTPPPEPQQPQYGDPQPSPPPYMGPHPAQPQYGVPTYGQPGYPVAPGPAEPSKAMAITALVLSLLCCFPIGLILAIVVLVRSKDGRNHGKGLAIGAVAVSIVSAVAIAAGAYGLTQVDWDELAPVEGLKTGECLNASNLTDENEDFVEDIDEVPCTSPHDAEVLATKDLTADEADGFSETNLCTTLLEAEGVLVKVGPGIDYTGLTSLAEPNAGDKLVCLAYRLDGTKLEAPL